MRKKAPKNKPAAKGAKREVLDRFASASAYAAHFKVSKATVTTWLNAGMPCVSRGKTRGGIVIDHLEADPWVATRRGAEKADSARTNVATEQAEKLRISNARERRELLVASVLRTQIQEACAALVQVLEAMPQRVTSDPQVQDKVADECRAARNAFAEHLEVLAQREGDLVVRSGHSPSPAG